MSSSRMIEDAIHGVFVLDPRITDPDAIAVTHAGGIATLRGTVGRASERRAATQDAYTVGGVAGVDTQLQVRLLDEREYDDSEIRAIVLQILDWEALVPTGRLDVDVSGGWVTLSGSVEYGFQAGAAYEAAVDVSGVIGVRSELEVVNPFSRQARLRPVGH